MRVENKQQYGVEKESGKIVVKGQQSYAELTDPLKEECASLSSTEML